MEDVKLFVTYKNKNQVLKSDIITPIQTGRAIAPEVFEDMLGDDTGDNISHLNSKYCELSAIYWVWKNYDKIGNPEKIGFMHYRRHFLFGDKKYKTNKHGLVEIEEFDENYLNNDLCQDIKIKEIVQKYDAILPKPFDVYLSMKAKNIYHHYRKNHDILHYDLALEILAKKYPQYIDISKEYNAQKYGYFLNMFVLKKEIFFDMCTWLFSILEELDSKIDYSSFSESYQRRVLGFIAERLLGIYFFNLKNNVSYLELPVSFIKKLSCEVCNNNIQKENEVTIAIGSSNEYVPYLSVFLESLKAHCNFGNYYEINILERNISDENKIIIKKQIEQDNIKINYINTSHLLAKYQHLCENRHFSVDTYARLFIPQLLINKKRCLYLDIDTIILDDVAKIFNTDLNGAAIGACRDAIMNAIYHIDSKNMKKYFCETLKLDKITNYFQGGVEVLDLEQLRNINALDKMIQLLANKDIKFVDQCIFNIVLKDKVKYIDMSWNYETYHQYAKNMNFMQYMDNEILKDYIAARNNPKIIHYAGSFKPWLYLDEEYANIWWSFARKTPYYELVLSRINNCTLTLKEPIKNALHYKTNMLKYWKYRIFSNLVFGKTKKRYLAKKYAFREKICSAKAILR